MAALMSRIAAAACFALFMAAAHAQGTVALTGQVSSAEEGPMEGVVVSAKRDGSTMSVSVITDERGRFAFPAARLEAGRYALKARAAGKASRPRSSVITLTLMVEPSFFALTTTPSIAPSSAELTWPVNAGD